MIISHTINRDPKLYPNPDKFDPLRFHHLGQQLGKELEYQHSTTGTDTIIFGHGFWACPGRFFAAAEIKTVAAYILTHHDFKLLPGQEKPPQQHWRIAILPNPEFNCCSKGFQHKGTAAFISTVKPWGNAAHLIW